MSAPHVVVVQAPAPVRVVASPRPIVAVVTSGPPGPRGLPGAVTLTRIAAQALGGHRVVRLVDNDRVDYASSDQTAHAEFILGLTAGAAAADAEIEVQTLGEIVESSWAWTPGPVFCGLNGVLTQTPPSSGFIRQIGVADAPDRIVIDLRPPIQL